jgi:hypothetical protein
MAAVVAGLMLSGCATTWPRSAGNAETSHFQAPAEKGEPGNLPKKPSPPALLPQAGEGSKDAPVALPSSQPDAQRQQAMLGQLRQLRATDPAAEDELLGRLQQSDPSLWPLVVEQFRATLAYRRAMEQARAAEEVQRLPPVDGAPALAGITRLPPSTPTDGVTQASYGEPACGSGTERLAGAIAALERETPAVPTTPRDLSDCARLRMLYAVAGRREDAARPIPGAPPAVQGFVSKEMEGLGTWLDAGKLPDAGLRAVESKPTLSEALVKLGDAAPLAIRNLAFCSEVLSYGCLKRFDKYEFTPGQEVLVYAEVENFASESTPRGYHTALRPSYQILDSQGQWVSDHALSATDETCPSIRHDYFLSFRVRLPKNIAKDRHTLRLVIADNVSRKVGQARLDFRVVGITDVKRG